MSASSLIRLGGLAAMVGGVAFATMGLVKWLWHSSFPEGIGFIYNRVGWPLFLMGTMAAVAALHLLQRERRYSLRGAVASLSALIGLALMLGGPFVGPVQELFSLGLLAAAVGILILGIVTIEARVLPWWCGAALIAGSPFSGFFLYLYGELVWLLAVPWVVVGYAVFRAAGRRAERPSRVR